MCRSDQCLLRTGELSPFLFYSLLAICVRGISKGGANGSNWNDTLGNSGRLYSSDEHRSAPADDEPRNGLVLNIGPCDARVEIAVFYTDRGPANTDFASPIESDVPIVVQHTKRLDSRQAENALPSTIAFAGNE